MFYQTITAFLHHAVIAALVALTGAFVYWFLLPWWKTRELLIEARKYFDELKTTGGTLDRAAIDKRMSALSPTLVHAWREFSETLHEQKHVGDDGHVRRTWRATTLANTFFTEQALVESRLHTEFFKHLPGILTGLGIIGTFSGLIAGLQNFQVVDDPNVVRASLNSLMDSVGGAFKVSATAIGLAMVATLVEKVIINAGYGKVDALCEAVDAVFESGASEDYLQQLVEATESSATQAAHIKDALVTELKTILTELTHQQMNSFHTASEQSALTITKSLAEGLKEPLTDISKAVQNVAGNQGDAVNTIVTDVLTSFAAKMESMFGQQLAGMNEVLGRTADTIQNAAQRFDSLSDKLQSAGTDAADAMGQRMEDILSGMKARQDESNQQMQEFINQLKLTVEDSQRASKDKMQEMISELSVSTAKLVAGLQEQATHAQQDHANRQAALAHHTGQLMEGQKAHLDTLTQAVHEASRNMAAAVEQLKSVTSTAVSDMKLGSSNLLGASERLTTNLHEVREATDGLETVSQTLINSAQTLGSAAQATTQALADQKAVRDTVALMVKNLEGVVANASKEAALTSQLVRQLESAADALDTAQENAESYLEGLNDVLGKSHIEFGDSIKRTLKEGSTAFHQELATAVGHLKGAIEELGDTLDNLPAAV